MAASTGKIHCDTCGKAKATYKCDGCSQSFSFNHLADHRQALSEELNNVEHERNKFRQSLTEQTTNPQKHPLIQRIKTWEQDSIKIIQKTADKAIQLLLEHTAGHIETIEVKLAELTEQLKQIRKENDFNEIHLEDLKEKLIKLKEELDNPPNISIQKESSSFINKISVVISTEASGFAPPGKYEGLSCKGRHCDNCGKCRDRYYTGDLETWRWIQSYKNWQQKDQDRWRNDQFYMRFKKRDGATCTYLGYGHPGDYGSGVFGSGGGYDFVGSSSSGSGVYHYYGGGCLCDNNVLN